MINREGGDYYGLPQTSCSTWEASHDWATQDLTAQDRQALLMLCKKPILIDQKMVACGQCMHCRINKKRIWVTRCVLEASMYEQNSFVTLTYEDDNLSLNSEGVPVLDRRDVQLFFKRLRKQGHKLRYYGVAEYGENTWRPHYHALLFGMAPCSASVVRPVADCRCSSCSHIRDAWQLGHILNGAATRGSAEYVAGYVTKKMTNPSDERLQGRTPEFGFMSRIPGIGATAASRLAGAIVEASHYRNENQLIDLLGAVDIDGKAMPLGKYLRHCVVDHIGVPRRHVSQEMINRVVEDFNRLLHVSLEEGATVRQVYERENEGRFVRSEKNFRRFKQARTL